METPTNEMVFDCSDHPDQKRAWLSERRIVGTFAGWQWGKTILGTHWAWNEYLKRGGCDGLIVAPTYKILNQATMRKFQLETPKSWGKYHKTEGVFKTAWGHDIYCRTDHKAEAIEGMSVGFTWSDEATLFRYDTWTRILARASTTGGRHLITSTIHRGQNWCYHELYKPWRDGDPDIDIIQSSSIRSPYFSREEYEFQKRRLRPALFRMRYDAQFERLEGLIYDNLDREKKGVVIPPFVIPNDWPQWCSVDFGISHAFVVCWWAMHPKRKRYYLTHLYYKRGAHIQDHVPAMVKDGRMGKIREIYAGAGSEIQFREDLKRALREAGWHGAIRKGFDDVAGGIERVYGVIAQDRLSVFDKPCMVPFWDESGSYQYDEDAAGNFTKDIKDKDKYDVMDSTRYGIASKETKGPREMIYI